MKSAEELGQEIDRYTVRPGTVVLWWLYQAGVVCKTPAGVVAVIDPYLSDAVTRSYGSRRNVPPPLDPGQVRADALLASHSHEDHLDPDSITAFMSHEKARFIGPPMAADKVLATGVPADRSTAVRRGDVIQIRDLTVRVVHARHCRQHERVRGCAPRVAAAHRPGHSLPLRPVAGRRLRCRGDT